MLTTAQARQRMHKPSAVPCDGCTACCWHDTVRLVPSDGLEGFDWRMENGAFFLAQKPDGSCSHLTAEGCGIRSHAPDICKRMDCRVLVLITPPEVQQLRAEENPQMIRIYDAGRQRLQTLGN